MPKGSQLSQLKSALSQAGITGQPKVGKKRKRSGAQEQDADKKAAKLSEIHEKLNAFDTKVTKLKHHVGGRKLKGVMGKPAQSKQHGIEQRKKSLLKEYEERGRSGGILDRRFGENDPTLTPEERMLERFTKERQRASKAAAFNLEDDADDLTHYGQSLSKLDDFDDVGLGIDDVDEERGQINSEVVKKSHFGGFDDEEEDEEPARKKTKAEVMAEVVAKSKDHKLRRQAERAQEDDIRHQLDLEFNDIRSMIYADTSGTGSNSVPLGPTRQLPPTAPLESPAEDYDQHVRELAFDKRAKAKDRTKTEEEIAMEEKERLEAAELKRKRRMIGEDEDSDQSGMFSGKGERRMGGDDLGDDDGEGEVEWDGLGAGLLDAKETEEDGVDDGQSEESVSEEEEVDEYSDGSEGEADDHQELVAKQRPAKGKQKSHELPYTFHCPETHEHFLDIVEDIDEKDVPTVVQRIRTLYHPSLGPDNNVKLQVLTTVIIDYMLYIMSPPSPRFTLLSSILPHLFALTRSYPVQSAQHFVSKISLMQKNLKRGLSLGALNPDAKIWPGLTELGFLHVLGAIWPTSDMNHAVISPTRLLMAAYLGLGRVTSLADIASGLFLCTLFVQFEELSKRFVPEAVNFAINTLLHLAPHPFRDAESLPGSFPAPDFRSEHCLRLAIDTKKAQSLVSRKVDLVDILGKGRKDEQTKVDLLGLSLTLIERFANMYQALDGFVELYQPIYDVVQKIDSKKLIHEQQMNLTSLQDTLGRLLKFARQARRPLLLQAHKPIPIPSYIPKFESSSSPYMRRQDPDRDRNEASKLRNQYKQERKGAIRELKKDARFLTAVEQRKQKEKDMAHKERMKRVFGSIEGERAEQKAMEREKKREKKRSGRK